MDEATTGPRSIPFDEAALEASFMAGVAERLKKLEPALEDGLEVMWAVREALTDGFAEAHPVAEAEPATFEVIARVCDVLERATSDHRLGQAEQALEFIADLDPAAPDVAVLSFDLELALTRWITDFLEEADAVRRLGAALLSDTA